MTEQWPTVEERREVLNAAHGIGTEGEDEVIARQVAAREKAAAEQALRDAARAALYELDSLAPRNWLLARADVLADEGKR